MLAGPFAFCRRPDGGRSYVSRRDMQNRPVQMTPKKIPGRGGGKKKIAEALKFLLRDRQFNAITTANIAETAGVSEALLYRYYGDKRGLLHQVLSDFIREYLDDLEPKLNRVRGTIGKMRMIMRCHLQLFKTNQVVAKILLLEVRSYPGYFESQCYEQVRRYSRLIMDVLRRGVEDGDIPIRVSLEAIRNLMLGGIDYSCLPRIVYQKSFPPEIMADQMCKVLFCGMLKEKRSKKSG